MNQNKIKPEIFQIMINPKTGQPLSQNEYNVTDGGVIILNDFKKESLSDRVYSCNEFMTWNSIVNERINYYKKKHNCR